MILNSIGIIGAGGVGGYFGGKLCQLAEEGKVKVSFVARGAHLRAIEQSGLCVDSEADGERVYRPNIVTDSIETLPRLDLCLVCVKSFDLPSVLPRLKQVIHEETIVLPLLNGVDIHSRVRSVIHSGIVLPACVYVGTKIERPGKIVQKGGACKILFGPDPERPDFAPDELNKTLAGAGIKSEWTQDIQGEIWQKFIFICAYGLVTAAFDKTLGEVLDSQILSRDASAVMSEAIAVATAAGIVLPANIATASLMKARSFPGDARTSFQRDFERMDKADERDLFAGALIDLGRQWEVALPKTRELLAALERKKPSSAFKFEPLIQGG